MARIIHARLDSQTEKILVEIERRMGWNDSQTVRQGIRALNSLLPPKGRRKIAGLGRFRSGKPDLGSNKRHLEGFGR
jgi:hypothetical protein